MKTLVMLTVLACASTVGLHAQATLLEHFQCYPVLDADPALVPPTLLSLSDQFNPAFEDVKLERPLEFCNPTRKIHRNQAYGVYDTLQHLTFYATFPRAAPLRIVRLRNQFGYQSFRVREPFALAVPTDKNGEGLSRNLDHFRCYAASGKELNDRVGLGDQFEPNIQGHVVLDPVAFCNPTRKMHGTAGPTSIINEKDHLACYSMTRTPLDPARTVEIEHQFGAQTITVGPPDTLCVPTEKLAWQEVPDSSVPVPGNPRLTSVPYP